MRHLSPMRELLIQVERHVEEVRRAYETNRMVNIRLAEAICHCLRTAVDQWEQLPVEAHPWFRASMVYFVRCNEDDESDFTSPIGFEDDTEIINACLRMAGRDDLCLCPEDYDDI